MRLLLQKLERKTVTKVLSLFDGISCGAIAFQRAGYDVEEYHACEINKHTIKVSKLNHPNIIRYGSVTEYHPDRYFDFLIGGSPCQGFSFAGKQLAFNDPRSKLFFEYVRILEECRQINPNIKFLLENVRMRQEYLDVISTFLGVKPICINSSLLSAQNRIRYYWTNWKNEQPIDLGIKAGDFSGSPLDLQRKLSHNIMATKGGGMLDMRGFYSKNSIAQRVYGTNSKVPTLLTNNTGGNNPMWITLDNGISAYRASINFCEWLQNLPLDYTLGIPLDQRYKAIGNGWTVDIIAHLLREAKRAQ